MSTRARRLPFEPMTQQIMPPIVRDDDMQLLYSQLRHALDIAYGAQPLDSARIDRIALDLLNLERSTAACQRELRSQLSFDL